MAQVNTGEKNGFLKKKMSLGCKKGRGFMVCKAKDSFESRNTSTSSNVNVEHRRLRDFGPCPLS